MALNAARLDRRLQFLRAPIDPVDEYGNASNEAQPHGAPVWASRKDVLDQEKLAAGRIEATLISRFWVRSSVFMRAISTADAFEHDGMRWNILGLKEADDGRARFVEITAQAVL